MWAKALRKIAKNLRIFQIQFIILPLASWITINKPSLYNMEICDNLKATSEPGMEVHTYKHSGS
jgi:hypothetical protein